MPFREYDPVGMRPIVRPQERHSSWHFGASKIALIKARLTKRDVPVHGSFPTKLLENVQNPSRKYIENRLGHRARSVAKKSPELGACKVILVTFRAEKGTQTQTFWSGYLWVGWGSST